MISTDSPRLKLHHSGRAAFKRCRRRWDLQTRQGWYAKQENFRLWFGSGFHAGLRALHSTNPPERARVMPAVDAYFERRKTDWGETPVELPAARELMVGMYRHYTRTWLRDRSPLETMFLNGEPLLEVPFSIPLPGVSIPFEGEIDRVVVEDDQIWGVEYKTAAMFDTDKLVKDPQVTSYIWAMKKVLGHLGDIGGIIYQQHRKIMPTAPEELSRGGVTQNKAKLASCPVQLYEDTISTLGLNRNDYIETIMYLRERETDEGDSFIRRDRVTRTPEELESFEEQLILEAAEYTNPKLPIYPNFTKDCPHDCDFAIVCDIMQNRQDPTMTLDALFTHNKPGK